MFLTEPEFNQFIKENYIDLNRTDSQLSINAKAAAIIGATEFQYTSLWDPVGPWVEFKFATPAEETFARIKFGFLG